MVTGSLQPENKDPQYYTDNMMAAEATSLLITATPPQN